MLAPNLLPKAVPHDGPRLLPSLIVRLHRRVVEGLPPPECASQARPSGSAFRERGPYPGHPRPVAPLPQREGLLALRFFSPASLLPRPVLPEPAQPQGASPGARVVRTAAGLLRGSYGPFGSLPRDGYDPRPCHSEGEGFPQRAVLRSGFLRAQRVEDGVGLRLQGGPGGGSRRGDHGLRSGGGVLRRAAHSRGPHSLRPLRCLSGRQGLHGYRVGATLAGAIRGAGCGHTVRELPQGMVEIGSQMGLRQTPDHRRSDPPTEGFLLSGGPPGEDVGRAAGSPGGQGRGLHLRPADQRFPGPTETSAGRPPAIAHCTSVVLGGISFCQSTLTPSLDHSLAHAINTSSGAGFFGRSTRSTLQPNVFSTQSLPLSSPR